MKNASVVLIIVLKLKVRNPPKHPDASNMTLSIIDSKCSSRDNYHFDSLSNGLEKPT